MRRILFLHGGREDYLNLGLLHGFRQLQDVEIIDVPKFEPAYREQYQEQAQDFRGRGFSLYGLLPNISSADLARQHWEAEVQQFDYILVSFPQLTWAKLQWVYKNKRKDAVLAIIEGTYPLQRFPYESIRHHLNERPAAFLTDLSGLIWYKREWEKGKVFGSVSKLVPAGMISKWEQRQSFRKINLCFPEEKITIVDPSHKQQLFSRQVIDPEVAAHIPGGIFNPLRANQYIFATEQEYYADLQRSRFGVTGKRAGWDCLRHYEMAANGVVLCFKDLDKKPATCAPYGLNESNAIVYHHYEDLHQKISSLTPQGYERLQQGGYEWVSANTTKKIAAHLLDDLETDQSVLVQIPGKVD